MKRFGQHFSAIFFILLSLMLLIGGRSQNKLVDQIRAEIFATFVPAIMIVDVPRDTVGSISELLKRVAIVFSDNEFLRAENIELKQQLVSSSQLIIDNLRLKNLLNIKEGTLTTIAASRIVSDSNSPFFRSMLINSGTAENVDKGHAVINEEGVVGRIINVARNSARVLLLNDINSRIPVKFAKTGVNAILAGDNSHYPIIEFIPADEKVEVGDQVLTSGMGGVFPPDLLVGQVYEITEDGTIKIKPSVNLDRLNYVSIVEYEISKFPVLQIPSDQTSIDPNTEEQ